MPPIEFDAAKDAITGRELSMESLLNPDDYEDVEIDDPDNPEWTKEDFARARPLKEVLPKLYEQMVREHDAVRRSDRKAQ